MTAARRSAGCVALLVALSAAPRAASPLSLHINLSSTQELSAVSTGALVAEVNAIWWNSNLSLAWRTADVSDPLPAMPEAEDWLRVLVLARQAGSGEGTTLTVGELVRHEGGRPLAVASITAARRIVDASVRVQPLEGPHDYDKRLGVVLGRAIAHEIGHYLLGPSHANSGLMRANIDALEFADVRTRSFQLDKPARAFLIRRASLSAPLTYGTR